MLPRTSSRTCSAAVSVRMTAPNAPVALLPIWPHRSYRPGAAGCRDRGEPWESENDEQQEERGSRGGPPLPAQRKDAELASLFQPPEMGQGVTVALSQRSRPDRHENRWSVWACGHQVVVLDAPRVETPVVRRGVRHRVAHLFCEVSWPGRGGRAGRGAARPRCRRPGARTAPTSVPLRRLGPPAARRAHG